jgi:hypothetical protein
VQDKKTLTWFAASLAFALVSAQAVVQISKDSDLDININSSFGGGTLTCIQQSSTIHVPRPLVLVERAKLKARLANLLRESLYDDANGIVNIAQERETKKLANKLRRETD